MRGRDYAWVGLGGMAGALARMACGQWLDGPSLAWGTLAANLLGTVLLVGISLASRRLAPGHRAALGTGFCGAFTTVSTLGAEVVEQLLSGAWAAGLGYLALSLLTALPMAVWLLRWHPSEEGAR
jgi:fluoride exporter